MAAMPGQVACPLVEMAAIPGQAAYTSLEVTT